MFYCTIHNMIHDVVLSVWGTDCSVIPRYFVLSHTSGFLLRERITSKYGARFLTSTCSRWRTSTENPLLFRHLYCCNCVDLRYQNPRASVLLPNRRKCWDFFRLRRSGGYGKLAGVNTGELGRSPLFCRVTLLTKLHKMYIVCALSAW